MFKVAMGQRFCYRQHVPAEVVAKSIRFGRGWPAGYCNAQYLAKGWRMVVVPTEASSARYARDRFWDHQDY